MFKGADTTVVVGSERARAVSPSRAPSKDYASLLEEIRKSEGERVAYDEKTGERRARFRYGTDTVVGISDEERKKLVSLTKTLPPEERGKVLQQIFTKSKTERDPETLHKYLQAAEILQGNPKGLPPILAGQREELRGKLFNRLGTAEAAAQAVTSAQTHAAEALGKSRSVDAAQIYLRATNTIQSTLLNRIQEDPKLSIKISAERVTAERLVQSQLSKSDITKVAGELAENRAVELRAMHRGGRTTELAKGLSELRDLNPETAAAVSKEFQGHQTSKLQAGLRNFVGEWSRSGIGESIAWGAGATVLAAGAVLAAPVTLTVGATIAAAGAIGLTAGGLGLGIKNVSTGWSRIADGFKSGITAHDSGMTLTAEGLGMMADLIPGASLVGKVTSKTLLKGLAKEGSLLVQGLKEVIAEEVGERMVLRGTGESKNTEKIFEVGAEKIKEVLRGVKDFDRRAYQELSIEVDKYKGTVLITEGALRQVEKRAALRHLSDEGRFVGAIGKGNLGIGVVQIGAGTVEGWKQGETLQEKLSLAAQNGYAGAKNLAVGMLWGKAVNSPLGVELKRTELRSVNSGPVAPDVVRPSNVPEEIRSRARIYDEGASHFGKVTPAGLVIPTREQILNGDYEKTLKPIFDQAKKQLESLIAENFDLAVSLRLSSAPAETLSRMLERSEFHDRDSMKHGKTPPSTIYSTGASLTETEPRVLADQLIRASNRTLAYTTYNEGDATIRGGTLVMVDPTALQRRYWESQKLVNTIDPDHWQDYKIEIRPTEIGRRFSDTVHGVIDANRFDDFRTISGELGRKYREFSEASARGVPAEQIPNFDPWIALRMDLVDELRGIVLASEAIRVAKESETVGRGQLSAKDQGRIFRDRAATADTNSDDLQSGEKIAPIKSLAESKARKEHPISDSREEFRIKERHQLFRMEISQELAREILFESKGKGVTEVIDRLEQMKGDITDRYLKMFPGIEPEVGLLRGLHRKLGEIEAEERRVLKPGLSAEEEMRLAEELVDRMNAIYSELGKYYGSDADKVLKLEQGLTRLQKKAQEVERYRGSPEELLEAVTRDELDRDTVRKILSRSEIRYAPHSVHIIAKDGDFEYLTKSKPGAIVGEHLGTSSVSLIRQRTGQEQTIYHEDLHNIVDGIKGEAHFLHASGAPESIRNKVRSVTQRSETAPNPKSWALQLMKYLHEELVANAHVSLDRSQTNGGTEPGKIEESSPRRTDKATANAERHYSTASKALTEILQTLVVEAGKTKGDALRSVLLQTRNELRTIAASTVTEMRQLWTTTLLLGEDPRVVLTPLFMELSPKDYGRIRKYLRREFSRESFDTAYGVAELIHGDEHPRVRLWQIDAASRLGNELPKEAISGLRHHLLTGSVARELFPDGISRSLETTAKTLTQIRKILGSEISESEERVLSDLQHEQHLRTIHQGLTDWRNGELSSQRLRSVAPQFLVEFSGKGGGLAFGDLALAERIVESGAYETIIPQKLRVKLSAERWLEQVYDRAFERTIAGDRAAALKALVDQDAISWAEENLFPLKASSAEQMIGAVGRMFIREKIVTKEAAEKITSELRFYRASQWVLDLDDVSGDQKRIQAESTVKRLELLSIPEKRRKEWIDAIEGERDGRLTDPEWDAFIANLRETLPTDDRRVSGGDEPLQLSLERERPRPFRQGGARRVRQKPTDEAQIPLVEGGAHVPPMELRAESEVRGQIDGATDRYGNTSLTVLERIRTVNEQRAQLTDWIADTADYAQQILTVRSTYRDPREFLPELITELRQGEQNALERALSEKERKELSAATDTIVTTLKQIEAGTPKERVIRTLGAIADENFRKNDEARVILREVDAELLRREEQGGRHDTVFDGSDADLTAEVLRQGNEAIQRLILKGLVLPATPWGDIVEDS